MSILRTFLKPVVELALGSFFRHIDVMGLHRIPKEDPLILVANHPNMMMDVLLLGISIGRKVHFLGKNVLFKTRLANWFLRSLGGIPVYRVQDNPGKTVRNQEMLKEVDEILGHGGCLAIFPEGGSHPVGTVHDLKAGAARIALRVEERAEFKAGLKIVPIGINYSDPARFQSNVFLYAGEPIELAPFITMCRLGNRNFAIQALTETIRERLAGLTIYTPDRGLERTVENATIIYRPEGRGSAGRTFLMKKVAIEVFNKLAIDQPDRLHRFRMAMEFHRHHLESSGFRHRILLGRQVPLAKAFKETAIMIFGFPLALYGFLNNILSYGMAKLIFRRKEWDVVDRASMKMTSGLVAFPICYLLQAAVVESFIGLHWATSYMLSLPVFGRFLIWYLDRLWVFWDVWNYVIHRFMKPNDLLRLLEEKAPLIDELYKLLFPEDSPRKSETIM